MKSSSSTVIFISDGNSIYIQVWNVRCTANNTTYSWTIFRVNADRIIMRRILYLFVPSIWFQTAVYTGSFIMFSVITNIYNKKTKRTLMEFFTATGKLKKFFFVTTRDVRCVHQKWHGTHRYNIQVLATHASTCWCVCGKNLNIVSMCAVSLLVHTSNISSCQNKTFSVFLLLWKIPLM